MLTEGCTSDAADRDLKGGSDSFEYQVHSHLFLDKTNAYILNFLNEVQEILDGIRKVLCRELGFTNDRIIDVPVLLLGGIGQVEAKLFQSID